MGLLSTEAWLKVNIAECLLGQGLNWTKGYPFKTHCWTSIWFRHVEKCKAVHTIKSWAIPFAIGRNILHQDTWAERGMGVYSTIISERGRARGLELCNYKKKKATEDSSHMHITAQLFLNFLIQHNKRTQYALKEIFLSGWIIAVCAHNSVMLPAAC